MSELRVAAVDLGATSGRVMAATVTSGAGGRHLHLEEVRRFPHRAVRVGGDLVWDLVGIYRELLAGLRAVGATGPLDGLGIDSWALDYGLLDRDGRLLGLPFSHRDARTKGIPEQLAASLPPQDRYAVTGLQELPFNTIYQLVASLGSPALASAETMLLLPDLLGFWLTGERGAERTNASTTGLYDVTRGEWSIELAERAGIPPRLLPPLRDPGDRVGWLRPEVAAELELPRTVPVIAVGSHDTASAVVGVPAPEGSFAFISSGTWSLVGLELGAPVLTEAARRADFTNEVGVDGTNRFLKNVMGLWVLSECLRAWAARDASVGLDTLLAEAATAAPLRTVVDINDERLLAPHSPTDPMPERIRGIAEHSGEPAIESRAALVRCVLDSLALAYRHHVRAAGRLSGTDITTIHVVGGGSRNELLCQLTADACEVPVLAGPAEAAALGNVLVQARALGADLADLAAMRALLRKASPPRRHDPRPGLDWASAESRIFEVEGERP